MSKPSASGKEGVCKPKKDTLSLSLCFFPLFLPVLPSRTFFLARKKTIDFAPNVGLTLVVVVVVGIATDDRQNSGVNVFFSLWLLFIRQFFLLSQLFE
ncbi:hypothetical protein F5H01DRAFT_355440 [Linnemannia elongata]|nr:hypothetical protein F5H01DRAFT_355440 [Linnemannia elongata]